MCLKKKYTLKIPLHFLTFHRGKRTETGRGFLTIYFGESSEIGKIDQLTCISPKMP